MKLNKLTDIALIAALAIASNGLAACSLLQGQDSTEKIRVQPSSTASAKNDTKSETPAGKSKPKTKKDKANNNKTTGKHVSAAKKQVNAKPEDLNNLTGKWLVTNAGASAIPDSDDMPYVIFDGMGKFYGSNGCNILNGNYELTSNGKIKFSSVLSTMKYCPDVDYDSAINQAFAEDILLTPNISRIGQESYLKFIAPSGNVLLVARRHNMEFLNGQWVLTSLNGTPIDNEEVNIFFDIPEMKVHGNTGCNFFNGTLYINPSKSNAIDISNMGVTRRACPNSEIENAYLLALEQVTTAIENKDGRVILLDNDGREIITLKKAIIEE